MATGKGTGTGTGTGTGRKKGTGSGRKKGVKNKNGYTMSDAALIQRKTNSGTLPAMNPEEMDLNARVIQHSMQAIEISKNANNNDPESLLSCFQKYLTLCLQNGMRIGNIGACTAMGISPALLSNWKNGLKRGDDPRYRRLAELVYSVCSMTREELISQGKINPVIGIFWQRNYDGLRNDTEQVQNIQETSENNDFTSSEYLKKYGNLLSE